MTTASTKPVKNMTKKQIQTFFERLREQRPNPKTELNYANPFELLVAVTLSAQATDVSVNKATDKLFPVANTPETIYALGVDGLKEYIKTIGLYNSKAVNVIKADRKSTRLNSSHVKISYAVFCSACTRHLSPFPTRRSSDLFELLVAVTLSAQATDVSVNKATDKLFPVANTPETIYALGVDGLKEYIKTIGLYNSKAVNVIK